MKRFISGDTPYRQHWLCQLIGHKFILIPQHGKHYPEGFCSRCALRVRTETLLTVRDPDEARPERGGREG